MKTQISKEGYRWQQRYSGVYQQQGRMITDSDWNELVEILKSRVDEALVDVIGRGMPKGRAVQVQMTGGAAKFNPGNVYAAGVEAVVDPAEGAPFPFGLDQQKGFPSAPPVPQAGATYRIYADVWDRAVISLEDEALRDPALHGADTCSRTQTMAQLKTCAANQDPQLFPATGDALLTLRYPQGGGPLGPDPCDSQAEQVDPVGGDFLFRLEVHDVRWPANADANKSDRIVLKWSRENGAEQYAFDDMPEWFTTGQWIYELYSLDSEKHLGYNRPVLGNQAWEPKRGTLVTSLPQTAPAKTMVRRWEGYCVLLRTPAEVWSVSKVQGETLDVTAPGAKLVFGSIPHGQTSIPSAELDLADLELTLEIGAKIFLPGDYWTVPVRRATYKAGEPLIEEAFPAGVIHRYVTLAEVLANGQLKPRTVAEQHRLAFPRLTELDAEDVGYGTTCNSGLFTAAHDTVEKALDRLCSINATHVGFTKPCNTSVFEGSNPTTVAQALALLCTVTANQIGYSTTCGSGLFDASHNTVTKALDRLCSIEGKHVKFSVPLANRKSIYEGVDPQTVEAALNLLSDVRAQQIAYEPASNPNVNEVKAALDELYARPVGNGSRVYIGPLGGQYASIDLAIADLVSKGKDDIALALLPGDHEVPLNWNTGNLKDINLSILGLGEAARLRFVGGTITFSALNSFRMDQVDAIFLNNSRMVISNSREVFLLNNRLESSKLENGGLITFLNNHRVVVRGNLVDVQAELLEANVVTILGLDAFESVADFFRANLTEFRTRAQTLGQTLSALPFNNRQTIGQGITSRAATAFQNNQISTDENNTYVIVAGAITSGGTGDNIARELENLRHVLYVKHPGAALVLSEHATGPVVIESNRSNGLIGLHGLPRRLSTFIGVPTSSFFNAAHNGRFNLLSPRHTLQVINNQVAGLRLGENMITLLMLAVNNPGFVAPVNGCYRSIQVLGNQFENEDNVFMADEVNLNNNHFLSAATSNTTTVVGGWTVGRNATYVANRGRLINNLMNGITNANSLDSANFRFTIVTFIIT